ncbi:MULTISPECIES: hypothetical protein [Streptacidiphilus]|uniref:Uncharacterized protein n=2 Tax=Streptacidiphilus TaxID=228398 RepID=A0ABV6ULQ1_9ACTN|nr:hypothetical protein [Streptacidiphilus jeojiense]
MAGDDLALDRALNPWMFDKSGVSQYIDTLASGYKTDATPQSIQQSGHLDSQAQQATSDAAQKAVTHALQGSGLSAQQINDYASTASTGALNGYQNGAGDDDRVNGNYS